MTLTVVWSAQARNQFVATLPLQVIDDAVQRIRDGSITDVTYDPQTARLVSVQ